MLKINWKKRTLLIWMLLAVTCIGGISLPSKAIGIEGAQKDVRTKEEQLQQLNHQMKAETDQIARLTQEISSIENEILLKEKDLGLQKNKQAKLYEDMKIRIQYMFENGSGSILEKIIESKSIADLINAVEYGNSITNYDRTMLKNYDRVCKQIQNTKDSLKQKQQSLQNAKVQCQNKQNDISKSIYLAKEELKLSTDELNQLIEVAKANEEKIAKEIAKQQEQQWLESQKPKPPETSNESGTGSSESENQGGGSTKPETGKEDEPGESPENPQNRSDLELLAALIECESGGEIYEGKIAVGSVILNRVNNSRFPNSIREVIYQGGQFAPAASGRLELVLLRGASSSCLSAAKEVLGGVRNVNCLFFKRNTGDKEGTIIGNHVFY